MQARKEGAGAPRWESSVLDLSSMEWFALSEQLQASLTGHELRRRGQQET